MSVTASYVGRVQWTAGPLRSLVQRVGEMKVGSVVVPILATMDGMKMIVQSIHDPSVYWSTDLAEVARSFGHELAGGSVEQHGLDLETVATVVAGTPAAAALERLLDLTPGTVDTVFGRQS
jgi:hypothetical protein